MRRIYDWMMRMAADKRAPWALALVSFIESSFFPIPPDVMLIPMVLSRREKAWWYATIATVASVLGGLLGYAIGYYFYDAVGLPILKFYGREHALDTFIEFVHTYGVPAVIIKGMTPIPFKVVTIAAGVAKMDLGAFIGGTWMMLVGTLAAALYPTLEVATALRTVADAVLPGFGKPLLLCSLLGLVTITSLNYYGASLTFLSVMDSIRPSRPTVAKRLLTLLFSTVVATGLALASSQNFVQKFSEFLAVLLYLFTPWTAINLVDFYLIRKGHYSVREIFNSRGMYGRWNWRGLWAYGIGFVAMIPFFSTEHFKGPVARALGGADIAMLIGLPVSALVYIAACRSLDVVADRHQCHAADLGLDPDAA